MAISETSGSKGLQGLGAPKLPPMPTVKQGQMNGIGVTIAPVKLPPPPQPLKTDRAPTPLPGRNVEPRTPDYRLNRDARAPGVEDRTSLEGRAGRPKDDKSFGLITIKMSTGYKAVLNNLDNYHNQVTRDQGTLFGLMAFGGSTSSLSRLHVLEDSLSDLKASADKYMNSSKHTHKTEIGQVRAQIKAETEVLESLMDQVGKGAELPKDMSMAEILDFARNGIAVKDMPDFKGMTGAQARQMISTGQIDPNFSPAKLTAYQNAGFTRAEAMLLEKSGLGLEGGRLYRNMDIPIRPDTIVKNFDDSVRTGNLVKLGKGAFNTVYLAKYKTGGGDYEGVFKPISPPDRSRTTPVERGWTAYEIGIDPYNPQTALRNLGTCAVAKELGFDVVPHTEIGMRDKPNGDKELGIIMSKAPGKPAMKADPKLFERGDVRREIVKLQLLDHLVGQGDRHCNNYFVSIENGKAVVTGIDNDQCLGKNTHDPNDIAYEDTPEKEGFRGCTMPPIIDTEMAKAIRGMTPEKLEICLKGLKPAEIAAAKDRLIAMKVHVMTLEMTGKVITPDKWGQAWIGYELNENNSYVGRDSVTSDQYARGLIVSDSSSI